MGEESGLTRRELIDYARVHGYRASEAQVIRWHKAGLLPQPQTQGLGRPRGSESHYPTSAGGQLVALCRTKRVLRRLDSVAWVLWQQGYPVTGAVRRALITSFQREERALRRELKRFQREDPQNVIDRSSRGKPPRHLGSLRRRVGKDWMPTVMRALIEACLGVFRNGTRYDEEDFVRFRKAFGIRPSEVLTARSGSKETPIELFDVLSRELSLPGIRAALKACSDDELERLRDEARGVFRTVCALAGRSAAALPMPLFVVWILLRRVSPTGKALLDELGSDAQLVASFKREAERRLRP